MTLWWLRRTEIRSSVWEQETLKAAKAGDREAIWALLAPHEAVLFRLCLAQLGNAADAEDAAQETLVQAIRALPQFRGDSQLRTWLIRIAIRLCRRRGQQRRETIPLDEQTKTHAGPEQATVTRAVLEEALTQLTENQRTVLLLQAVEGWSMREIAESLGVTEKKIENELYRARKALARWKEESNGSELD